jgi:hypothetical protein
MTIQELQTIETEAYKMLETTLDKARTLYALNNNKFEIGDYIRSITGIIKVEQIIYQHIMGSTHIGYCGYKYWYKDKQLVRTKKKEQLCLTDYNNIVKVEENK